MDGYKIIDFKGVNPVNGGEVPGIYNAIDESTKPIMVTNVTVTGSTIKPYFALAFKVATSPTTNAYYLSFLADENGAAKFIIVNDNNTIDVTSN